LTDGGQEWFDAAISRKMLDSGVIVHCRRRRPGRAAVPARRRSRTVRGDEPHPQFEAVLTLVGDEVLSAGRRRFSAGRCHIAAAVRQLTAVLAERCRRVTVTVPTAADVVHRPLHSNRSL